MLEKRTACVQHPHSTNTAPPLSSVPGASGHDFPDPLAPGHLHPALKPGAVEPYFLFYDF